MKKILLFDWGNTIMVDYNLPGAMYTWEKTDWVPGAEEALKALTSYTCCIATNAGKSDAMAVKKGLAMVGADPYFSYIFASSDLGFEKPSPEFFFSILRTLDATPDECIMIGDNYRKDIEGAKNAGIRTVFYNRTHSPGIFPSADAIVYHMSELPDIIENV
jgi:HAD superfamily hydrolase (TIGR01662 family)